jgi:hypothetical protein
MPPILGKYNYFFPINLFSFLLVVTTQQQQQQQKQQAEGPYIFGCPGLLM